MNANEPASYRYDDQLPADSLMLEDLLKATEIQQLFESYYKLISIPVAIIDLNANVLLSSRWQRICTQFHRVHPVTCRRCVECDTLLATQLDEGQSYTIYPCKNGLTDCASPIILDGRHIANVFVGQFLTGQPDEGHFLRQAAEFGFDVEDYLAALREVPIATPEKVHTILDLLVRMTRVITNLGMERKKAVESQARQAIVLNTMPQPVFWKDVDGRYMGCNAAFAAAAGLENPEDVAGRTDFDLPWPESDAKAYRAGDREVISSRRPRLHTVEPLRQADGTRLKVDACKIPLLDAAHHPYGVLGIYQDITERELAKERLEQSELRFRSIVEHVNDAFYIHDFHGRILDLNENACRMTGYRRDELLEGGLRLLQGSGPLAPTRISQVIECGQLEFDSEHRRKDGGAVTVAVSARLVSIEGDGVIQSFVRDISERKRAERELSRLNRELRAISDCNQSLVRAEDESALLNDICTIVCERAGYCMAWVGFAQQDEAKTVRPVAWAGNESGYLADLRVSWADEERGRGPTGTAIRTGETVYIKDFLADPRMAPWRVNALSRGYRSNIAIPLKDTSGAVFGAFTVYSPQPDAFNRTEIRMLEELAGDISFGINVLRDRIEQKRAEKALAESQSLMHAIIDSTEDLIWSVDPDSFGMRSYNRSISEYFSRKSGIRLRIGMRPEDLFPPGEYVERWRALYRRALAEGPFVTEYISFADHLTLELDLRLLTSGDTVFGISVFAKDITQRKLDFERVRNLSQRLQLATSAAHLGVWDWNIREDRMVWDERMYQIYGVSKKPAWGGIDLWSSTLHPDDRESVLAAWQGALDGTRDFDREFRIVRPDGKVRHVKGNGLVIRGEDGAAERMIGTNLDITERKVSEEEKAKLEAELHQSQKMESIGSLAGGVAHDFNNKLGVILGYTQLADRTADPAELRSYLLEIRRAAEQSAELTRQLLAFARKQAIAPRVLDLNTTVAGMLKMLYRLIGENITLRWLPGEDLWRIHFDPSQVDQILANLCVNARDAISGSGTVTIETGNRTLDAAYCARCLDASPGEYVRLTVGDTGCGMDQATRARIFEPFFTTKEAGKGTGLGLATVFGIVKQNNGFIEVDSVVGMGTTFTIYLPRHRGKVDTAVREGGALSMPRGCETILLVEDELSLLQMASISLTRQGYLVLQANTPAEALRLAREHGDEVQLLVTDVIMAGMNGKELAAALRAMNPQLRCLFMSGYPSDVIAEQGTLEAGVNFMQKPFYLPDLAKKVREILDGGMKS